MRESKESNQQRKWYRSKTKLEKTVIKRMERHQTSIKRERGRKIKHLLQAGGGSGRVGWVVKWCARLRSAVPRFAVN